MDLLNHQEEPITMTTTPVTITTTNHAINPHAVPPQLARGFLARDTKTGPIATPNGRTSDTVRNATWLPSGPPEHGGTCPGASTYCHKTPDGTLTCYARRLELGRTTLGAMTTNRLTIWKNLTVTDRTNLCAAILQETHRTQTQPGPTALHNGHPVRQPTLRIGAGGDLATTQDGQAWSAAIAWAYDELPNIRTWLYTRSYGLDRPDPAEPLANLTRQLDGHHLTLYLSTDPTMTDRTHQALTTTTYSHLPVAILADTLNQAHTLLDSLDHNRDRRRITCPVDSGTMPITTPRRNTNHHQGACHKCRACWANPSATAPDIIFIRR